MALPDSILNSPVFQKFIEPLREAASAGNPYARSCPEISDIEWAQTNIMRIIQDRKSGRDHLQSLFEAGVEISIGLFFKNLRSQRRLNYISHLLQSLVEIVNERRVSKDPLAQFDELNGFDVHLGDGSFFEHSCHDEAIKDAKRPIEHFFTKNARTRSMSHLAMARIGGDAIREHDASVLKRKDKEALRQGAPKGRKVLYVWDRACIGFDLWHKLKTSGGIYFITRNKSNIKYQEVEQLDWDREDGVNKGVEYDQFVKTKTEEHTVRRVIYKCPLSGKTFSFITNLPKSVRPGVIAHLYRIRWGIEKSFDEIKNKYGEKKAWSKSDAGKLAQAKLIAMTYNLLTLFDDEIEDEGIVDTEENKRREKRLQDSLKNTKVKVDKVSDMLLKVQRSTQRPLRFIRWFREKLYSDSSWIDAVDSLRYLYGGFPR